MKRLYIIVLSVCVCMCLCLCLCVCVMMYQPFGCRPLSFSQSSMAVFLRHVLLMHHFHYPCHHSWHSALCPATTTLVCGWDKLMQYRVFFKCWGQGSKVIAGSLLKDLLRYVEYDRGGSLHPPDTFRLFLMISW